MFDIGLSFDLPEKMNSLPVHLGEAEKLEASWCQGHPMLPARLHTVRRHGPGRLLQVDLAPFGLQHLVGARGGQDQELEGEVGDAGLTLAVQSLNKRGQSCVVIHRPGRDHVELAGIDGLQHGVEPRTLVPALGIADAGFLVDFPNLPARSIRHGT